MANEDEDVLEVANPEEYSYKKEDAFSHPATVMKAYMRCLDTGAQEMRKGFWQDKLDKFGNKVTTYMPDTRMEFINSVETLKNVLYAHLVSYKDTQIVKEISSIFDRLDKEKEKLIAQEETWWNGLPYAQRSKIMHFKGMFNQDLIFYQQYISLKVDAYRELFECLEFLLSLTTYLKKKILVG